jgi:RimJ/RimL family protein N-acetyltransferase
VRDDSTAVADLFQPMLNSEAQPGIGALVRAGTRVDLRRHVPANRDDFVRWYRDPEIAVLLRHDLRPLTETQARGYFESIVMPASARNTCWAIHEHGTDRFIGSTAVTDIDQRAASSKFRIVIGEKEDWSRGFGSEATLLVAHEAFTNLGLRTIRLEVFTHNQRAFRAYQRVGFLETGRHTETVPRLGQPLHVIEMQLDLTTLAG